MYSTYQTTRFGTMEVSEERLLTLSEGLIGFERFKHYFLVDRNPDSPFKWLQSAEEASLAFVVVDPFQFYPDYEVDVNDQEAASLELKEPKDTLLLNLVVVPPDPSKVTINLLAPLVINTRSNRGRQVVLSTDRYQVRHPLRPLAELAEAAA